jgi:biopolymer transport protein ExbD
MAMAIAKLPDDDEAEGGNDSIFAEINITPLTDVFLVMVIIFMVSALAVQVEAGQEKKKAVDIKQKVEDQQKQGLKIDLPQGPAQDIDPSKVSLVLEVPLTGDVVVGGNTLKDPELDNLFRAAYTRDKGTQVIIKADKGVTHGRIVNLMERAKVVGLTHLAFGTGAGP